VSALLFVLALVGGAVYLFKFLSGRRAPGGPKAKGIQVLATRPLGPRQALLLVDVGGVPLLLAQGEGMVNLIAEIRDPDAVRRLNDLYGFRETPFEAELRGRLDLEGDEPDRPRAGWAPRAPHPEEGPVPGPVPEEPGLSPEERLAALRRRPKSGGEP
jgi:flagellar biosynthetic protein FliO